MKPVNLLPVDVAVASPTAGKPNLGMIGGAIFGFLAVVGVAGYFAMARVDTIKSETAAAQKRADAAASEVTAVNAQVQALGSPVVDSDKQLAQGAEQVLVSAYAERHDFVLLAQELRAIMEGTGGWYVIVEASSAASGDDATQKAIEIQAYMPTKELAASFNERVNAARSMANAETVAIESERLTDLDTRRPGIYFKFTVSADLVDMELPSATENPSPGTGDGLTVADGEEAGDLGLSLDPKPTPKPAAPARPAKPKNPFDVAATVAGAGGGGAS